MAPHGIIESAGGSQEFSISGQVVIDTLTTMKQEVNDQESPHFGLRAHATVMTDSEKGRKEIERAIRLATHGDETKEFKIKIEPDGLGATWVDLQKDVTYEEVIPEMPLILLLGGLT